jgi:hypothetical protein
MKSYTKGSITIVLLIIIVLLVAVVGYMYFRKSPASDTNTQVSNNTENTGTQDNTNTNSNPTLVSTTGWKRYDSGRGFEFKYPTNFTLDNKSTGEQIILEYNEQGQGFLVINLKNLNISLEQYTKNMVKDLEIGYGRSAAPVTISYKPHSFGNVSGYLISIQAGDVLKNTDAYFITKGGNTAFTFRYSFQAANATKSTIYSQIQTIISTFKYF